MLLITCLVPQDKRPPTKAEMNATSVLALPLHEVSAKVGLASQSGHVDTLFCEKLDSKGLRDFKQADKVGRLQFLCIRRRFASQAYLK